MRSLCLLATALCAQPAQNYLFVTTTEPPMEGTIQVVWIPEPILKLCLGKTANQCAAMDFCIRTTTKNVSTCKNLPIPLARLPKYPPDMHPRRQLSITYSKIVPKLSPVKGIDNLVNFFHSKPSDRFARLSMDNRIRARVSLTVKPNDDDFNVLEFFAAP